MPAPTSLKTTVDRILVEKTGQGLNDTLRDLRRQDLSFEKMALAIGELTGGLASPPTMTVWNWYQALPPKRRRKVPA